MLIQPNSRLLFIGDSITDCGRRYPVGNSGDDQALGNGFVSLVDAALTAVYPDYGITTLNTGISGNTIRNLKARWTTDVLDLKPDWLGIMIGVNDAWQYVSGPPGSEWLISTEEYAQTLDELIRLVRPSLKGVVVMNPFYLQPDLKEPMRAQVEWYGEAGREAAERHEGLFVDTQAAFDAVCQSVDPLDLAADRVHVNLVGHMILARAFLTRVGFDWERSLEDGHGK